MKWKKIATLMLSVALLMVVSGCSGAKEATFTSEDGIVVTANDKWQQLTGQEELAEIYDGAVDDETLESVDLALRNETSYFTIETADVSADLENMRALQEIMKDSEPNEVEEILDGLRNNGFLEEELAPVADLAGQDADVELVYQQMNNAGWLVQLATYNGYNFVGSEDAEILGKASEILEYSYINGQGMTIHFYEASIIENDKLYIINAWCEDSQFAKQKDILKTMMTTAKWSAAE